MPVHLDIWAPLSTAVTESGEIVAGQTGGTIQCATGDKISGTDDENATPEAAAGWKEAGLDPAIQVGGIGAIGKVEGCAQSICHHRCVCLQGVVTGPHVMELMDTLSQGVQAHLEETSKKSTPYSPLLFHPSYTWLRVKGHKEMTPEHADWYYFQRETDLFMAVGDETKFLITGEEDPDIKDPQEIACARCGSCGE